MLTRHILLEVNLSVKQFILLSIPFLLAFQSNSDIDSALQGIQKKTP